mmetsp:Transcript_65286/g.142183  ORF Transcript_65286/g.142183 Transcript_65286/m.142183 type:complete len:1244 (-) Transcript_65286:65-3796(-)
MRQIRLVPSGAQAWHHNTIGACGNAFAYSSTMALHIYRLKDNCLVKMIAAHERAISGICWSPEDSNLLASCSVNGRVIIWDLENEEERFGLKGTEIPVLLDWASGSKIVLAFDSGDVKLWEYKEGEKLTKLFSVVANTAKVLRWHPRDHCRILLGASDGSLTVYDQRTGKKVLITGKAKTSKDSVTDAQWDPLSEDYLLAAFSDGSMTLFDASTQSEIHSFDKQAQGIKSFAWATAQPGNFVTCTERVGVLRIWNVSQRSPLMQIKVGSTGVNCIKAIPSEPNWFVLSYKNGSVGVCDISTRTMRFTSQPGHSETIFDVAFHPDDPDVIATASYDGHVKIWRVSTVSSTKELYAGKDQLLYGLSWGPGAVRICAVSSTGVLFVWRTDNGEQVLRLPVHTGQAFRCEWSQRGSADGSGEIATGGADKYACVVNPITGNIRRIKHPAAVIGVSWHWAQDNILATGCQDGIVRVFNVQAWSSENIAPIVEMAGHDARVFNVAFHPICREVLASGSDDKTIRVWNWSPSVNGSRELRRLTGHTSYVRGLLWHSELPQILFSGSWDSTIRVWDVANQQCIHVSYEHHADVYGLALHRKRPFFLVSSSRDTTLRFWIFEDKLRPLVIQALVQPDSLEGLLGTDPSEAMAEIAGTKPSPATGWKLYGEASKAVVANCDRLRGQRLKVFRELLSFFMYRQGMEDLWGILAIILGEPPVGASGSRSVFHEQELIKCQKSKALELASSRVSMGIGLKLEDRLLKAAQIMLRVGDLQSYCRLTAQAGQWERAICIAPAVSHQFWLDLTKEYVDSLSATNDIDEVAPFWVASGSSDRLVNACIEGNDLDSAFVVAKAVNDGLFPTVGATGHQAADAATAPPESRMRLEDVAAVLSARYADQGEPLQAAMCFLAVSLSARAVDTLSRSHEAVLAFVVAELLGQQKDPIVVKLLAQCVEKDLRWGVAADLWAQHPLGPSVHLPLLAARVRNATGLPPVPPALAQSARTLEQHQASLAEALARGDSATAVLEAVCVQDSRQAIQIGCSALHALFCTEGWTIEQARRILDPLEYATLQGLAVKDIANTLACSAYVGLVEASNLGYVELLFPLAQTVRNIVTHQRDIDFPVSIAGITLVEASGTAIRNPALAQQTLSDLIQSPETPAHVRVQCEQRLAAIQAEGPVNSWDRPGLLKIAGGSLPSCSKKYAKNSVLTNTLIKGPAFELEDRQMHVSIEEALSWARVNAFSPLNTGCTICPL